MPKLYFRYGTMNSSKTANLLMVAHNYMAQNKKVLLIKPLCDNRFGANIIASRAGPSMVADLLITPDIARLDIPPEIVCILVDEAQFLSSINIDALRKASLEVPVICYGLRTDYLTNLFPGSKRLMEVADTIEEIKTTCIICQKKAIVNAKFQLDIENSENKIIRAGSSAIDLGTEDKYHPLCWECWESNDILPTAVVVPEQNKLIQHHFYNQTNKDFFVVTRNPSCIHCDKKLKINELQYKVCEDCSHALLHDQFL